MCSLESHDGASDSELCRQLDCLRLVKKWTGNLIVVEVGGAEHGDTRDTREKRRNRGTWIQFI